ncbi:MAG: prenyltransferase/squalene oxidase repeat-containing protein, partial [bacterium]
MKEKLNFPQNLANLYIFCLFSVLLCLNPGFTAKPGSQPILDWVLSQRYEDGGFGPIFHDSGAISHHDWTRWGICALKALDADIADTRKLPVTIGKTFKQCSLNELLFNHEKAYKGKRNPKYNKSIYTLPDLPGLTANYVCWTKYSWNTNLQRLWVLFELDVLGYKLADTSQIIDFTKSLQKSDGGFNVLPNYDFLTGAPIDGKGNVDGNWLENHIVAWVNNFPAPPDRPAADYPSHLIETYAAVKILLKLGSDLPRSNEIINFVQSCQNSDGGFKYSPTDSFGNYSDIWYTWAAVTTLADLGAEPVNKDKCISWIESCHNIDGGYSDKPSYYSRLEATFYAVDALNLLNAASYGLPQAAGEAAESESGYHVYTGILKAGDAYDWDIEFFASAGFDFLAPGADRNIRPAAARRKKLGYPSLVSRGASEYLAASSVYIPGFSLFQDHLS